MVIQSTGLEKQQLNCFCKQGSFGLAEFGYTTFGLDVLVVDDDGGGNYEEYFQSS